MTRPSLVPSQSSRPVRLERCTDRSCRQRRARGEADLRFDWERPGKMLTSARLEGTPGLSQGQTHGH